MDAATFRQKKRPFAALFVRLDASFSLRLPVPVRVPLAVLPSLWAGRRPCHAAQSDAQAQVAAFWLGGRQARGERELFMPRDGKTPNTVRLLLRPKCTKLAFALGTRERGLAALRRLSLVLVRNVCFYDERIVVLDNGSIRDRFADLVSTIRICTNASFLSDSFLINKALLSRFLLRIAEQRISIEETVSGTCAEQVVNAFTASNACFCALGLGNVERK